MHHILIKPKKSGDTTNSPFVAFSVRNKEERDIKGLAFQYGQIGAVVLLGSCCCGLTLGGLALVMLTGDGSEAVEPALEKRIQFEKDLPNYHIVGDVWDADHEEEMVQRAKARLPPPEMPALGSIDEDLKGLQAPASVSSGKALNSAAKMIPDSTRSRNINQVATAAPPDNEPISDRQHLDVPRSRQSASRQQTINLLNTPQN